MVVPCNGFVLSVYGKAWNIPEVKMTPFNRSYVSNVIMRPVSLFARFMLRCIACLKMLICRFIIAVLVPAIAPITAHIRHVYSTGAITLISGKVILQIL